MRNRILASIVLLALLSIAGTAALDQKPAAAPKANLANCPVSLSNPDGQDLVLEKMDVRIAAHGPLSLTEVEMVFRNPEARQMEGRFLYVLPTGATVSRFAKEVNGQLMEGEVVETQQARRAYREILHTMRDPALLEQDQGNRFSAKVFPIPANGTARLLLSYSRVTPLVDGDRKLVFPLLGLPKIGEFNFRAVIWSLSGESVTGKYENFKETEPHPGNYHEFSTSIKDFTATEDIEIIGKADGKAAPVEALRAGDYQMTVFRPAAVKLAVEKAAARNWVFFCDTSASGVDTEKRRLEVMGKLTLDLTAKEHGRFSMYAFDIETEKLFEDYPLGTADQPWPMPENLLRRRHSLGATDLGQTLKRLGDLARGTEKATHFVLVSDGIPTWGAKEIPELLAALGEWPKQHVLHALVIGQKQDEKVLAALTEKTGGRVVVASLSQDPEASASAALAALIKPMGRSFEFYDEGAAWIYPKTFQDVQPGSELVVFSQLKDSVVAKPGVVERMDGKPVDTPLTLAPKEVAEFAPLLKREAIGAELSHMEKLEQAEKDAGKVAASKAKRVELSVKNRVLCAPLTSLLVLETERDYARFKIDRNALGEIMVVGARGIEMQGRKSVELAKAPEVKPEAPKQTEALKNRSTPVEPETRVTDEKYGPDVSVRNAEKALESMDYFETDIAVGGGGTERALSDDAIDAPQGAQGFGQGGGQGSGQGGFGQRRLAVQRHGGQILSENPAAAPPPAALATNEPSVPAPPGDRVPPPEAAHVEAPVPPPISAPVRVPDWVKLTGYKPADAELNALRAQIAKQPMNRGLRNTYADGLARLNKWDELQAFCFEWLPNDPENAQVYEFLGKSAAGLGDKGLALRALSSLAEIGPKNAALLGRAGWVLLASKHTDLAADLFQAALKERQDDPNLFRGLALAQWLGGKNIDSLKTYDAALKIGFNPRYGDVQRVLREEAAYVARATGANAKDDEARLIVELEKSLGLDLKRSDALRVTMGWETDANDVDLHVVDPSGEECWYSHTLTSSKLELYSDQTRGLGPEIIRTETALKGNYEIGVTYFNAGPMGVSRGVVVIFKPENGQVREPRIIPFVLLPEATGGANIRPIATVKF